MCNSIHDQWLVIMCIPQSSFGQFGLMSKVGKFFPGWNIHRGNHQMFVCSLNRCINLKSISEFLAKKSSRRLENSAWLYKHGDKSAIFVSGLASKGLTGFWRLYV